VSQVKLSASEKLLLVAKSLDDKRGGSFSAEDLVVEAWKRFPDTFGLRGHLNERGNPLYPDSNRVFAEVMGSKPLRRRGWLAKSGNKLYRLTETGRQYAARLSEGESAQRTSFSRETVVALQRLLDSRAAAKYGTASDSISFHDASAFWGINARSNSKELAGRLAETETILDMAQVRVNAPQFTLSGRGTHYTPEDLNRLRHLHRFLQKKFANELSVIAGRRDERSF